LFLRLEFPTFLTITFDPIFIKDGCGTSIRSIYKSSTYWVGNGVSVGVGVGVSVGVGVGLSVGVGVGVSVGVTVGVLEGVKVNVGVGVAVGISSTNFFFQGLLDPVLVP
jgi:hypothetical protein